MRAVNLRFRRYVFPLPSIKGNPGRLRFVVKAAQFVYDQNQLARTRICRLKAHHGATMELEQIRESQPGARPSVAEVDAVSRRILCVFPRYARSFGTFDNAYPLLGV